MPPTIDPTEPTLVGRFWHFADGTILPLVRGGDGPEDDPKDDDDEDDDPKDDDPKDDDPKDDDEDDDPKEDPAKAAAKWKALARKHEAAAKKERQAREKAEQANASEGDKAKAAARAEGEKAARERLAGRLLVSAVKVLAKDKMAVPARLISDPDAVKRLLNVDLDDVVSEDGEVDEDAISDAIDALLAEEPELAKAADDDGKDGKGKPKAPTGARSTKGKRIEDLSVEEMRAHLAKQRK